MGGNFLNFILKHLQNPTVDITLDKVTPDGSLGDQNEGKDTPFRAPSQQHTGSLS